MGFALRSSAARLVSAQTQQTPQVDDDRTRRRLHRRLHKKRPAMDRTTIAMHTACELCRGACCEGIIIPAAEIKEETDWLEMHGSIDSSGKWIHLNCKCRFLLDGRCVVWESRPRNCREYAVGSMACLMTVRMLRPGRAEEIEKLAIYEPS